MRKTRKNHRAKPNSKLVPTSPASRKQPPTKAQLVPTPPAPVLVPSLDLLTIVIKSFNRPQCLDRCLKSVRKFYPKVNIVVLDDSTVPIKPHAYVDTWIAVKEFIGLNEGRNRLVSNCDTPYCSLIEDDYVFTANSRIDVLLTLVRRGSDIAGGQLIDMPRKLYRPQARRFTIRDKVLHHYVGYTQNDRCGWPDVEAYNVHYVGNFFVARTEFLRHVGWDPKVAIGDTHADFFLDVWERSGKVVYTPTVSVQHWPDKSDPEYRKHRGKISPKYVAKKHGYAEVIIKKIAGVTWKPQLTQKS